MGVYRKFFLLFILSFGLVCGYSFLKSSDYFVLENTSVVMKPYAETLVKALNNAFSRSHLNRDECRKLTVYPINWTSEDKLPLLSDDDKKCTILWLGSQQNLLNDNLTEYHSIWVSTPLLQSFLASFHIPSVYVPIFPLYSPVPKDNSSPFFAIVEDQPIVKKVLEQLHLPFKQYNLATDIEAIRRDISSIQAVFGDSTKFTASSIDINPLFLEMAQNQIPIIVPWIWPQEDTINLFNDRVFFYQDEQDLTALIQNLLKNDVKVSERILKAAGLVRREFSLERNIQRIIAGNTDDYPTARFLPPLDNSVAIDIPTAIGHYTAGDYALACDLADFLKLHMTSVDLTFYNSIYKYPAEINILLRGFVALNDYDLQAPYNILYLAYAQFAQNETQEMLPPFEDYLKTLQQSSQKVQALIVASQKISDALNARGIKTYYIPQFTNTSRFYYDFDEKLKSEVLFVGMNNFYRTAVPALLKRGIKVDVYGPNWPQGVAKAEYADNQILRKYYSSAKIVLNDTREGMKQFGFISNRIFDASACGTLVISDYMPEIEQIYGDSIPLYRTDEELYDLVQYYLTHDKERIEKATKAREITLKYFTAKQATKKFLRIIDDIKKN